MKIPYVNIQKQYKSEKKQLLKIIDKSLYQGNWVGGPEIEKFEKNIANICKTKYCVSLNSGTDALTLALHLFGVKKGDEVITPSNSFIASTAVAILAKPVSNTILLSGLSLRNGVIMLNVVSVANFMSNKI